MKIVVDSNILIDHTRKRSTLFTELTRGATEGKWQLLFPTVVTLELYRGAETSKKAQLSIIDGLWTPGKLVEATLPICRLAGFLLRDYQQLPDPIDAIVAATAIENGAELATRNRRHYKGIKGLRIFSAD